LRMRAKVPSLLSALCGVVQDLETGAVHLADPDAGEQPGAGEDVLRTKKAALKAAFDAEHDARGSAEGGGVRYVV